jgi:hypothetical protein
MLPPSLFIHQSTRTGRTIVEMHVANEAGVVVVLAVSVVALVMKVSTLATMVVVLPMGMM